jgi:hypothetical protein
MYLNKKQFNSFLYVTVFIAGFIFIFYPSIFSVLSPYTTEEWLPYHWWYAYHSLINPGIELLHAYRRTYGSVNKYFAEMRRRLKINLEGTGC